jgi:enamine deaminase RidA (YjgF/YER057c/UK114 family)
MNIGPAGGRICCVREPAPAVTAIVVSGLARPEYLIEIEAMAVSSEEQ